MATLGEYLGAGSGTTKLLLHLNGNSTDSSGNSNNGTDTAIIYSQANGKFGQGAGFNGTTSKIVLPAGAIQTGANNRTWSCLFYKTTTSTDILFGTHDNSLSASYWGIYIANALIVQWNGDVSTATNISLNTLNNIVCTYDGTDEKTYLNGYLIKSQSKSLNTSSTYPAIGINSASSANPWHGAIDEVITESVAWSAEKVKKYYTMAKGRFGIV